MGGRKRENEREKHVREKHALVASHPRPNQGPNPQLFGVQNDAPPESPGQGPQGALNYCAVVLVCV